MTELIEMTEEKSLSELKIELEFQLSNGENLGGTIASHISHHITIQENKQTNIKGIYLKAQF